MAAGPGFTIAADYHNVGEGSAIPIRAELHVGSQLGAAFGAEALLVDLADGRELGIFVHEHGTFDGCRRRDPCVGDGQTAEALGPVLLPVLGLSARDDLVDDLIDERLGRSYRHAVGQHDHTEPCGR